MELLWWISQANFIHKMGALTVSVQVLLCDGLQFYWVCVCVCVCEESVSEFGHKGRCLDYENYLVFKYKNNGKHGKRGRTERGRRKKNCLMGEDRFFFSFFYYCVAAVTTYATLCTILVTRVSYWRWWMVLALKFFLVFYLLLLLLLT